MNLNGFPKNDGLMILSQFFMLSIIHKIVPFTISALRKPPDVKL